MVAGLAVRVDAAGVAADAEVVLAAGEQVPDDDQDGAGDQGLEFAAALEDPPVTLAGEGVRAPAAAAAASPGIPLR